MRVRALRLLLSMGEAKHASGSAAGSMLRKAFSTGRRNAANCPRQSERPPFVNLTTM
jgi:hypothetical protein